jgi:hypothetical protein
MKRCIQFVTAVLVLLLAYPLAADALDPETAGGCRGKIRASMAVSRPPPASDMVGIVQSCFIQSAVESQGFRKAGSACPD